MNARIATLIVPLALAGCTFEGGVGVQGPTSRVTPNAGEGSGTLIVDISATVFTDAGTPATEAPVSIDITVADAFGTPMSDVVVFVGPVGNPVVLAELPTTPGTYEGTQTGYQGGLEVSVNAGEDFLTEVRLGLAYHETGVDPDPPAAQGTTTVSWTPSGEPGVGVDVFVLENSPTPGATYTDSNLSPNDGVDTLPASAFPEAGVYQIEVRRSFALDLNSPSSYGSLLVVKALHRTVP